MSERETLDVHFVPPFSSHSAFERGQKVGKTPATFSFHIANGLRGGIGASKLLEYQKLYNCQHKVHDMSQG